MDNAELQKSFADRINQQHKSNIELSGEIRFSFLRFLNQTRECGLLIEEAKCALGHTAWRELQGQLDFGNNKEQVIQTYLNFARKNPEQLTDIAQGRRSLDESMMITGLLPFPDGHGPQLIHIPNLFSWAIKATTSMRSELKKRIDSHPIGTWTKDAAGQFVATFEPAIEELTSILMQAKQQHERLD